MNSRSLVAITAAAFALAAPSAAHASNLYVQAGTGDTQCTQDDPCNLGQAITIADIVSNPDTIHITGALTSGGIDLTHSPIELIGSGSGDDGTQIQSNEAGLRVGPQSSASKLSVDNIVGFGVVLDAGAVLRDAQVQSATYGINKIASSDRATTIDHVEVDARGIGIRVAGVTGDVETTISNSHVVANIGVDDLDGNLNSASFHLDRSTIEASDVGVQVVSTRAATITNSVIRSTVDGVRSRSGALILINGTTIDGAGAGRDGIWVESGSGGGVDIHGSIVRGFDKDLNAVGDTARPGRIAAGRSDYATTDGAGILDAGGNVNVEPRWLDGDAGDYRLAADSPLIDAGYLDPSGPGETDRAGLPRNVDGDGSGGAARDVGAYEYQRPVATTPPATTPPATGGAPMTGGDAPQGPAGGNQQQPEPQEQQHQESGPGPVQHQAQAPAPAALKLTLGGRTLKLDPRGRGTVKVACSATPCKVKLTITAGKRKLAATTAKAGKIKVRLPLSYLKKHHIRRVKVTATIVGSPSALVTRAFRVL